MILGWEKALDKRLAGVSIPGLISVKSQSVSEEKHSKDELIKNSTNMTSGMRTISVD